MKPQTRRHDRRTQSQAASRPCDHPECTAAGEYRAPRSRESLDSYFWFCLEHVREYNSAWNYYAGMTPDQIEKEIRADAIGRRPTWPLGRLGSGRRESNGRGSSRSERFADYLFTDPFDLMGGRKASVAPKRPQTPEDKARELLNLSEPVTLKTLKARYKELVKQHHPDANGGDPDAGERLRAVILAYKTLLVHLGAA